MTNRLQIPVAVKQKTSAKTLQPTKTIHNPKSGHRFTLLQTAEETAGELLAMEVLYKPHSEEPPAHYHPFQTEQFTVLEGEMTLRIDGQLRIMKVGDTQEIYPNVSHSMWNDSDAPALMYWRITPALQSEQLFETLADLAISGKTDEDGRPGLLYAAMTFNRFNREFRLSKPSFFVQKLVFGVLTWIGRVLGYRVQKI